MRDRGITHVMPVIVASALVPMLLGGCSDAGVTAYCETNSSDGPYTRVIDGRSVSYDGFSNKAENTEMLPSYTLTIHERHSDDVTIDGVVAYEISTDDSMVRYATRDSPVKNGVITSDQVMCLSDVTGFDVRRD